MYLVYFDESGNAGLNLADAQQPIFVLCALLVPDDRWAAIESDLLKTIDKFFPQPRPDDFEIHANELINPRGFFRDFPIPTRLDFFKACLDVAVSHKLKVIHRAIVKKSYQQWLEHTFGAGILINPHRAAFALVAQVVNDYLRQLPDTPLGIFISDENKDVVKDIASACTLAFISEDERFNSPVLLISHTCISWFKAHPCHQ